MKIKLLDGSFKEFDQALSVKEIASSIAISLGKSTVGAKVNGVFVSADFVVDKDVNLELVTTRSEYFDDYMNMTSALITGIAIAKLYKANLAETYYNADEKEFAITFEVEPRIGLEQLESIQAEVNNILKLETIKSSKMTMAQAEKEFAHNPYQLHLAQQANETFGYVPVYTLCDIKAVVIGGIITDIKVMKVIDIQQLTGSYWLNDSENVMLQRVHGMCGINQISLDEKKAMIEERRSRDHRLINKQLNIFGFDNLVGPGLPLWMPNGTIIKDEIKTYLKLKEWEYDYVHVTTPVIGSVDLYRTSGHWDHYGEDMFQPFSGGNGSEEQFVLRPMNCPHHIAVYKQEQHSYRELPIRIAEHAIQHRYESSGSLTGLERVRGMELTDSHIFVRPDQLATEFKQIYKLISEVLTTFNIEIDYLSFSLRDPQDKNKYFQDDKMWNDAEAALEAVLDELNLEYKKCVGEAAFYGPKLDIQIKTAQNHEITVSTIQLDFLLPRKFDVTYVDQNQEYQTPIMIHRGLIGTYERFIATLLEQTKGVLPLWLAPNQVEIIPIGNSENFDYAEQLRQIFKKEMIRSHIDLRDERLSYKIRDAQTHKVPFQLVIGNLETQNQTVTFRRYGSENQVTISQQQFIDIIKKEIASKQ
ncbi:threonine--tRNA ligase [Mesoplasma syrphidae]|uniref:Threonine--tRNA ligase n=1 Tax=Mesoplasma syrphidae TaxID=225999 RepID=A0A2K9BVK4_9MOLU|nr:threonine--tRNA ligase [Mesoplasma syrphidae]AUF83750.1 threonine--tRNA ligase [Mesoplasma syrphidae]